MEAALSGRECLWTSQRNIRTVSPLLRDTDICCQGVEVGVGCFDLEDVGCSNIEELVVWTEFVVKERGGTGIAFGNHRREPVTMHEEFSHYIEPLGPSIQRGSRE